MINVAFVIDSIESPTGGTEKQLLMLIRHLDRSRFKPYLCVLRLSQWLRDNFSDCELIEVGVPSFAKLSSYSNVIQFSRFLKRQKIDVVLTYFIEGNKVGVVAGKIAGAAAIVSSRRNQGYWHSWFEMLMLNSLNMLVTRFLANSCNTKEWVAKTESISRSRIHVIHNSLEIDRYGRGSQEHRYAFREDCGFSPDTDLVGIVANLRPVKAIDVFLRAAKSVALVKEGARFVVVGEGPDRARLELLCEELGICHLVSFLGKRVDIPELLGCIDVGVLSSTSESFSNSIVEYLAAGLPVVCTDVGGAREAVEDGFNGYVVPPDDPVAMAAAISAALDRNTMMLMGQRSREKATFFSVDVVTRKYEDFLEEVLCG